MKISRRKFVQLGSAAGLTVAAGCNRMPEILVPGSGYSVNDKKPFKPPFTESVDLISHHLNRLSFGPRPGEYERVRKMGETEEEAVAAYIEEQLHPERISDPEGAASIRGIETLNLPADLMFEFREKVLLRDLVRGTNQRAIFSRRQLYEVMVQFWTDHFNIDPTKGDCRWLKTWDDREVVRKYALGDVGIKSESSVAKLIGAFALGGNEEQDKPSFKFPDMVRASALSPAMLWYLDGRENRTEEDEDKPNENYARELLELHTLGVHGGYTQGDVMEVARCLTGWTVSRVKKGPGFALDNQYGKVEFKPGLHDDNEKTVLGETIPAGEGAKDLDHVLRIVSLHPSTAKHLATKLCRRFIADEPPADAVKTVAQAFLKSEGDIRETLRALFATDNFRNTRGNKFKRPFNFIVSALRATDARTDGDKPIYDYMLRMGHAPFNFPTPDGYPEEATPWMGTLLWRWNFALALSENRIDNGTRINPKRLAERAGGGESLMAHLLGRKPNEPEIESWRESGNGLALALASPAFQWS
ncbi:MAG: hypothetical protein ACI8QF_002681 [Limisphaerales bacterium]|jgi:uncharacterized protein (DUF1800 family)